MSFGCYKSGANATDKRLIARYASEGWPIDRISQKLSVRPDVIKGVLKHAGSAAKPKEAPKSALEEVAEETAEEATETGDAEKPAPKKMSASTAKKS